MEETHCRSLPLMIKTYVFTNRVVLDLIHSQSLRLRPSEGYLPRSAHPTPPYVPTCLNTLTFQLNAAILSRFKFTDNEPRGPVRPREEGQEQEVAFQKGIYGSVAHFHSQKP